MLMYSHEKGRIYLMGLWDSIKSGYNKIDQKLGGILPGGAPRSQPAKPTPQPQTPSSSSSSSPQPKSSPQTNSTISSGNKTSGGGSGGGSSISLPSNLTQQSSTPLPYQTRGTSTDLAPKVPESVKEANISVTYGGGSSSKPASAPATGASGSALNQGGGPASPSSSGGSSGAVMTAATGGVQKPYDPAENMSFGEKVASVFNKYTSSDVYRNAAQRATGTGDYQTPKPITAIGDLLSPLQVFAPGKKGDVKSKDIVISGGTGIYNPQTGQYDDWVVQKGQTTFERLQDQAFLNPDLAKPAGALASETSTQIIKELQPQFDTKAASIASGYQTQINAGKLTVEQATPLYQKDIASLQADFQAQAESLYSQRIGPKIAASQAFSKEFNWANQYALNVPTIGTTAALIGAGFAGGSSVAAVRAISGVANVAVAVEGQSNIYEGIANKNYLQATLGAAAFGLGTYGALRYAANEVTIAQIEGVSQKSPRLLYGSRTELRENYFQDIYKYQQATSSAKAVTRETVFTEFYPESNTFKIISGSSETTVKTTDFWTGKTLYAGSYRTFQGGGMIVPRPDLAIGGVAAQTPLKGISFSTEGFTGSISELRTTQQYAYRFFEGGSPVVRGGGSIITQQFGGESKLKDNFIYGKSGPLLQKPYAKIQGQGFTAVQEQTGIYKIDTFSILKFKGATSPTEIYFEPSPASGLRANLPSSGSGVTSITQAQSVIPSMSLANLGAEQTLKSATSFVVQSAENFAAPATASASMWVGTGLYERSEQYQIFAPALAQQQLKGLMQPPIVDVIPGTGQIGGQIPVISQSFAQTPVLDQLQSPGLTQDFAFPGLTPGSPTPFRPFVDLDLVGPGLPKLKGFEPGELGMGPIPSGRQRLKYTPDFEALVFGIKGKAPPGGEAPNPFASRPITRGFSFAFSEGPDFGDFFKGLPQFPGAPRPKRRRR